VMAVCPDGHDSASGDFCDVCGLRITAAGSGAPAAAGPQSMPGRQPGAGYAPSSGWTPGSVSPRPGAPARAEACPRCGTLRIGRFCEACGFSFAAASGRHASPGPASPGPASPGPASRAPSAASPPAAPRSAAPAVGSMETFPYPLATWIAVVGADRAYYDQVQAVTGPEGAVVEFPDYCAERSFQLVGSQMRIGRRSVTRGLAPEIDLTGPPADPGISRLHAVLIAAPDGNWAVLDPGSANGTLLNGTEITIGEQVPLHHGDRINLGAWTAISVHRG
jgi:hypothetical protein